MSRKLRELSISIVQLSTHRWRTKISATNIIIFLGIWKKPFITKKNKRKTKINLWNFIISVFFLYKKNQHILIQNLKLFPKKNTT